MDSFSKELRDSVILEYLPLVRKIAMRIFVLISPGVEYDDLVSYGILGLLDAVDRHNISGGTNFESYAVTRISGSIYDELRLLDWVPRGVRSRIKDFHICRNSLEYNLVRSASDVELANACGISLRSLDLLLLDMNKSRSFVSIDGYGDGCRGDNILIRDSLASPISLEPSVMLERMEFMDLVFGMVSDIMYNFSNLERKVLMLYYYEGLRVCDLGEILDISVSKVSRIKSKALRILSSSLFTLAKAVYS